MHEIGVVPRVIIAVRRGLGIPILVPAQACSQRERTALRWRHIWAAEQMHGARLQGAGRHLAKPPIPGTAASSSSESVPLPASSEKKEEPSEEESSSPALSSGARWCLCESGTGTPSAASSSFRKREGSRDTPLLLLRPDDSSS